MPARVSEEVRQFGEVTRGFVDHRLACGRAVADHASVALRQALQLVAGLAGQLREQCVSQQHVGLRSEGALCVAIDRRQPAVLHKPANQVVC